KSQQHVAWHTAENTITGVYVEHTARHCGSGSVDGPAPGLYFVHGLILLHRVEVPQDASIMSGVRAQVPIESAREDHAGDQRHCCRLRWATSFLAHAVRGRCRRVPDFFSGAETESE